LKAELVFVGTELLLGEILNTNAQFLSERLALLGIDVYYQQTVGDNWERLTGVLREALSRADVVITSGGLGPTMDDITRDVAAEVAGCPLALDAEAAAGLEAWFARRGAQMAENNRRQAMVPKGATVLPNDRGTAPGLIMHTLDGKAIVLLPGPPFELKPMFEQQVIPFLTGRMGGTPLALVSRTLRFIDIGESAMEDQLKDMIAAQGDPSIGTYARLGECHVRLATKAPDTVAGQARIGPVEGEIRRRLGHHVYGADNTSLEQAVGELLKERGLFVATAESCTGGLVAKRLTDIPGSSAYFGAGFVTYSYEAKTQFVGVSPELLATHGAVSEPVVRAMAQGALERSGAGIAVAISGIAGPEGGTPDKPVGTVWFGLAARGNGADLPAGAWAFTRQLWGSRSDVRERSATAALAAIRRYLIGQKV
jgi:nicotinamide-nucleotide amidase